MIDVFVSSPFNPELDFKQVFKVVEQAATKAGLTAYRVDHSLVAVQSITDLISKGIRESRIVVADLTMSKPNVLHEIGQAQSLGKPLVLLSQEPPEGAPFNVRGLPIIRYSLQALEKLGWAIERALKETTTDNETLRSMLVPRSLGRPTKDSRFVIAASPLSFRRAVGRKGGYKTLRRTSSDYVGLRGIMQAFGLLYGFDALPDSIDPEDFDENVHREKMNLYCIASPKANGWTGLLLEEYAKLRAPRISFRADPASPELKNVRLSIFSDKGELFPRGWDFETPGDRFYRDYGVIIRDSNPYHEGHMATILAGRSSLGTEAACMAFTNPQKVKEIRQRLVGLNVEIEDHRQSFCALVKLERNRGDGREEANPNTLEVKDVFEFRK